MSENNGYFHHYSKAKEKFIDWYYKKHPDLEYASFWFTNLYGIDQMLMLDDELNFALDAFEESQQVKILYNYDIRQHVLKIKWEVNPWWENQVLHFYYCVMLPIDKINLVEPAKLVRREEE